MPVRSGWHGRHFSAAACIPNHATPSERGQPAGMRGGYPGVPWRKGAERLTKVRDGTSEKAGTHTPRASRRKPAAMSELREKRNSEFYLVFLFSFQHVNLYRDDF